MRKERFAVFIGNNRILGTAIRKSDKKTYACNGFTRNSVGLYNFKAWLFFVENNYLRFLTCEKLYMVFCFVKNIVGRRFYFLNGVNSGFKIVNDDISVRVGNSVKIV